MEAGKNFKREAMFYIEGGIKDFSLLSGVQQNELASAFFRDQTTRTQHDILIEAHDYDELTDIVTRTMKNPIQSDFTVFFIGNIFKYIEDDLNCEYSELEGIYRRECLYENKEIKKYYTTQRYIDERYV